MVYIFFSPVTQRGKCGKLSVPLPLPFSHHHSSKEIGRQAPIFRIFPFLGPYYDITNHIAMQVLIRYELFCESLLRINISKLNIQLFFLIGIIANVCKDKMNWKWCMRYSVKLKIKSEVTVVFLFYPKWYLRSSGKWMHVLSPSRNSFPGWSGRWANLRGTPSIGSQPSR